MNTPVTVEQVIATLKTDSLFERHSIAKRIKKYGIAPVSKTEIAEPLSMNYENWIARQEAFEALEQPDVNCLTEETGECISDKECMHNTVPQSQEAVVAQYYLPKCDEWTSDLGEYEDYAKRWGTDGIKERTLYTDPPNIQTLIDEAIKAHDEKMAVIRTVNTRQIAQPYIDQLIGELDALSRYDVKSGYDVWYMGINKCGKYFKYDDINAILDEYRHEK